MKKSIVSVLLLCFAIALAVAQISFTNETTLQFAADAIKEADAGFNRLRNQFDINGDFEKFSFNGRLRLQAQPAGKRNLSDGIEFFTGLENNPSDSFIRANAYIRPVSGLELAFGTNIDYSIGVGSNWGDYETSDFITAVYYEYYGRTEWAKNGFAIKYAVAGFEAGVSVPVQTMFKSGSDFKMNVGLLYTRADVFSIGAVYFANFANGASQAFSASVSCLALEAFPFNVFGDYSTGLDSYMTLGVNLPMYLGNLSIEPEFAYRLLLGSDYSALKNPWFAGVNAAYIIGKIKPSLWFSYASGHDKDLNESRMDINPSVAFETSLGTLGIGFNLIVGKNLDEIPGGGKTYIGWELPISWTITY